MADVTTLSVTPDDTNALENIVGRTGFSAQVHAAWLALVMALQDLGPDGIPGPVANATTKWNKGTIDPTGDLRTLVEGLRPDLAAEPYRTIERLIHHGIPLLKKHVDIQDDLDIEDLLTNPTNAGQSESAPIDDIDSSHPQASESVE